MLDWVISKWEKNKGNLEAAIPRDKNINDCEYVYLVELVVHHILNDGEEIVRNNGDSNYEINMKKYDDSTKQILVEYGIMQLSNKKYFH